MTGGAGTVIGVLTAVVPTPAVHTHALVRAVGVVARAAVLACVGHQLALINILCAELTCRGTMSGMSVCNLKHYCVTDLIIQLLLSVQTCKFWFTLAVVGVDTIYTGASILALVTGTVINVVVACFSCETWSDERNMSNMIFFQSAFSVIFLLVRKQNIISRFTTKGMKLLYS